MSPGTTADTHAPHGLTPPLPMAVKYDTSAPGVSHELHVNARRLVDRVTDLPLSSGVFYASAANTINGLVVNHADISTDPDNPSIQKRADDAIHCSTTR